MEMVAAEKVLSSSTGFVWLAWALVAAASFSVGQYIYYRILAGYVHYTAVDFVVQTIEIFVALLAAEALHKIFRGIGRVWRWARPPPAVAAPAPAPAQAEEPTKNNT